MTCLSTRCRVIHFHDYDDPDFSLRLSPTRNFISQKSSSMKTNLRNLKTSGHVHFDLIETRYEIKYEYKGISHRIYVAGGPE